MALKVLLTVPDFASTNSPWREVVGLAKHLPKDRYELTVCALRPTAFEAAESLFGTLGVRAVVSRFRPRGRGLSRWLSSFRDGKALRECGPFDLQHSMDFTASPFEALMSRRHAGVFVFTQRNMNEDGSRLMLKMKSRLASSIICVSDAARRVVEGLGARDKSVTVYPGIETEAITWRPFKPPTSGSFRILMVGHVLPRKRFEDALLALAELAPEYPQLRLRIVGREIDSAYRGRLDRFVRENNLTNNVEFIGPQADVFGLMCESDLFLHTATSEAFGMVVIEALAVGLPVIASRVQGPSEIIEHERTGLLVPPAEPRSIAASIRFLLQHPDFARQLSESGRRRVESCFSSRRMASGIVSVYDSLLGCTTGRTQRRRSAQPSTRPVPL